jgi:hypothetical protein
MRALSRGLAQDSTVEVLTLGDCDWSTSVIFIDSEAPVPFLTSDPHGWNLRELTLCVHDWSTSFEAALTTFVERSVALRKLTISTAWAKVFPAALSDSFLAAMEAREQCLEECNAASSYVASSQLDGTKLWNKSWPLIATAIVASRS